MPKNKNQLRRLQTLLKMLRQNRYPNYPSFLTEMKNQDIAGTYQLCSKTFQRDIIELRDEYGAPIHYDNCRKGYYLTNTDWYNEDLMVEPFEMKAAILGERVASEILPEPLRGEMNKAINALLSKNENGMAEQAELDCFKVLCPEYLPQVEPQIFLTCYNAWEQRKYLVLRYKSAKGNSSVKMYEPHVFAWSGGSWYLKGMLTRNNDIEYETPEIRVLALHRIQSAEVLDCQFITSPQILKSIKNNSLFNFEKISEVEIEFFTPFSQFMYEKYVNTPGAVKELKKDSVVIKLQNLTEYEAIQLVFSALGNAKVCYPESLKLSIRKIANTALGYLDC
jgi:predicted DNA-binding transcriptional regulator YafY